MPPRPDVSDRRRSQIIDAAIRVFARRGVSEARMDDIAAEAGVSKGLLYWYFASREMIVAAIAEVLFGGELDAIDELPSEDQTAREWFDRFLDVFIEGLHGPLDVSPVIYEFYALATRDHTVNEVMQGYIRRSIDLMEPIVRMGMGNGELRPGDARRSAIAIGSMIEGTLLFAGLNPGEQDRDDLLRRNVALVLDGLEA